MEMNPTQKQFSMDRATSSRGERDMEQHTVPPTVTQSEEPYAPPKATFVPLKLEERLFESSWNSSKGWC